MLALYVFFHISASNDISEIKIGGPIFRGTALSLKCNLLMGLEFVTFTEIGDLSSKCPRVSDPNH